MQKHQNFIDNKYVDPVSGEWIDSFDPYTGKPWARIPASNAADVELAVAAASRAMTEGQWPSLTATQRGKLLFRVADLIEANAERLANIETQDNGKLLKEMRAQLASIPEYYRYFAGAADKLQGAVIPNNRADMFNFTQFEPLGVVAAITPWNSPLLVAATKLGPALAAGNACVLKPSEHASVSSLEFAGLFAEAGFPAGVVNVVSGLGADAGAALAAHKGVAKIAFTGGEPGGRAVYEAAAKDFKKVLLELGGKSPNIVFEDAILDDAVNGAISGIFAAAGQSCIAGSRLLLQDSIHDEFVERLIERAGDVVLGNPFDDSTQIGPVTTRPQFEKIREYVDIARDGGALCVLGGGSVAREGCENGWFVEPTIFIDVTNDMRIAQEEVFGPVLSIIRFQDEADAVRIANDIDLGLAAGVWTQNIGRGIRMAKAVQAGTVWVNAYRTLSYLAPFGGFKKSGIGRISGSTAILEYVQQKTVWINVGTEPIANPFVLKI